MARSGRGLDIAPPLIEAHVRVLSPDALAFIDALAQFLPPPPSSESIPTSFQQRTAAIRAAAWKAPLPAREFQDLRTGLLAPLHRPGLLGALNSGARLCLADLCDATSWQWDSLMAGQANLMDRWTSAMEHVHPETGKRMSLPQRLPALMLRVRPLQAEEPRVKSWGQSLPAGLFDAALYLFHSAKTSLAKASGPYLCLTGVSSRTQARRWNDGLVAAQSLLGLPAGTVRVMVSIDTPGGLWDVDEILHELRDHVAAVSSGGHRLALACARLALSRRGGTLPDPFLIEQAVSAHLVRTAHRRGIPAISAAMRTDAKEEAARAVRSGWDGLILSGPEEVGPAARVLNDGMPTPNQIYVTRDEAPELAESFAEVPGPAPDEELFRAAIREALFTFENWLSGRSSGGRTDLSRAEFNVLAAWHWIKRGTRLSADRRAGEAFYEDVMLGILKQLRAELGEEQYRLGRYRDAVILLRSLVLSKELPASFPILAARKF
ncbi:hypothetical protein [Aestuariivirga sp.]|uniref:hypothetical protein n=1 Tax=Aestuariivirga sp. TaxID=2650926 RepID=UPI00391AAB1F